jgi:hypothetical protein
MHKLCAWGENPQGSCEQGTEASRNACIFICEATPRTKASLKPLPLATHHKNSRKTYKVFIFVI